MEPTVCCANLQPDAYAASSQQVVRMVQANLLLLFAV
jgi:hypothetical protein